MEVYLVGGAVRDRLLGLPARERDWVVVGASPEELADAGYRQVGKDFPVFLHPETGEEYALARRERKVAPGYHGFQFEFGPEVTLEEDLSRRDLTINAMAMSTTGELIDPFSGQVDLSERRLRHVSDAFREDPVRIARVARFAARFAPLGFTVDPATNRLMHEMVSAGEAAALRPERLWQEMERALGEPSPQQFVSVLRDCGALAVVLPEVEQLFGVPQPARWHPEVDTGVHLLMALELAAQLSRRAEVRYAVLTHDLGKGTTDPALLPKHRGHEERGIALIEQLGERLPVPRRFQELAILVARYHGVVHRADELKASTILKVLLRCDALRRPERFADFLLACEADARGRKGLAERPYPQAVLFRDALRAAREVPTSDLTERLEGRELGDALERRRLEAIRALVGGARLSARESGD